MSVAHLKFVIFLPNKITRREKSKDFSKKLVGIREIRVSKYKYEFALNSLCDITD